MAADFVPDLVTIVGTATVLVGFIVMGSGLPACMKMYKTRSTGNVPYILFLILLFMSTLGFQYGIMMGNKTLIINNLIGLIVWGAYIAVYISVSRPKSQALFRLFALIALYLAHMYYLSTVPSAARVSTIGKYMLTWALMISIVPVGEIYTIIRTKSTNCCDMPLFCGGTLNIIVWCLYGYLMNDINIYFPTIPGLLMALIKFALMLVYGFPAGHHITEDPPSGKSVDAKVLNGKPDNSLRQRK